MKQAVIQFSFFLSIGVKIAVHDLLMTAMTQKGSFTFAEAELVVNLLVLRFD